MNRTALVVALAVGLVFALAACSKPAPAPAAPPTPAPAPTGPAKGGPPPKLTGAQTVKMEADFTTARRLVEEARALREQGLSIEREKGVDAANSTYFKARKKYREAAQMTEQWIEGEIGVVTQAQVEAYLRPRLDERAGWIKEDSSMPQKLRE